MSYHDDLFPKDISYGARGGPEFSTTVLQLASGYEKRNINWSKVRARYNVTYGIRKPEQMDKMKDFFYARFGRAYSFPYFDHKDHSIVEQQLGTGNGVITRFQVYKRYSSAGYSYDRLITKIRADSPIRVTVGGVERVLNGSGVTGYTVGYNSGIITFNNPPPNGQPIVLTCQFYVHVRFDSDFMDIQLLTYDAEAWADIILIEIKEDPL